MANKPQIFYVIPRYTGGSPGMVEERLAKRIAAQERAAYPNHLEGVYGEEAQKRAESRSLEGIVLVFNGKSYVDVITGRDYGDMPYSAIRYPDTMIWTAKGRQEFYYYKMARFGPFHVSRADDDNMVPVGRELEKHFGISVHSHEMYDIWKKRLFTK